MRYSDQPTMRFSIDQAAADRLGSLAQRQGITIAALLRNLVYQAINNNASQQEIGREQPAYK